MTSVPPPVVAPHKAPDRTSLVTYRHSVPAAKGRVLVVHGYLEHAGRYAALARALNEAGLECLAFDLRGHGQSGGPRAHVDLFSRYVDDVRSLLAAPTSGPGQPTFLFGHSLGGLIALLAAAERRTTLAGLLLSNPYLENAAPIPAAKAWLARVAHRLVPRLKAPAGLDPNWMVADAERSRALRADPAIQRWATAGWLYETLAAQAVARSVRKLDCPAWFGIGAQDPIADPGWNKAFAERLLAPDKEIYMVPEGRHEPLQDRGAEQVMASLVRFIGRCLL